MACLLSRSALLEGVCCCLTLNSCCRVEYFGVKLEGFTFTEAGWVQSYGSRYVRPPIIHDDISRPAPMTVKEFKYAQSLTKKPVKGMLTGTDSEALTAAILLLRHGITFRCSVRYHTYDSCMWLCIMFCIFSLPLFCFTGLSMSWCTGQYAVAFEGETKIILLLLKHLLCSFFSTSSC